MSVKTTLAAALSLALCFSQCSPVARQKASQQWQPLFNGKDLTNWIVKIHGHETGDNYAQTFRADSGMIRVRYDGYQEFKDRFGHLFYHIPYGYYKLRFEYRFAQPWRTDAPGYTQLNSGVMFHAQDPRTILKEQDWPISVEFQLLAGLPDGQPRPTGNMCSPGTDVVFNGKLDNRHCINSTSKTYPPHRWVKAELVVLGDSLISHIIEGDTVLQYSKPTIGGGVVNRYNQAEKQDGKPLSQGYIALQSEGQPIDFRNIELLNLEGCMDKQSPQYRPWYIKQAATGCK